MKQSIILLFLLGCISVTFAQQDRSVVNDLYSTVADLQYRDSTASGFDDYMRERCRLDVYYPSEEKGFPTVVWFHGGGLKNGNKFIPQQLKEKGIAVVAVNYRMNPKVTCPAYIDDAAASVAWVFRHIAEYGGDPDLIFVSGHSAGGYLASMIGLDTTWLEKYGVDANAIAGLIPYSGHTITHFTVRAERGIPGTQAIVDPYAPLFHVREDAPPLILITGDRELELLGRYEETAYLMRMMKVVGHTQTELYELGGYNHGAMAVPAHHILLNKVREIAKRP